MTDDRSSGVRRARAPRGQGQRLRDELLDAAERVLAVHGADGLSLRAVAREAGVAAPSVYLHYRDLDALRDAMEGRLFERIARTTAAAVDGEPEPRLALRAGCLAYLQLALDEPARYRALFVGRPRGGARDAAVRAMDVLDGALRRAGPDALGRRPRSRAADVWVLLHGIADLRSGAPSFPWPPLAEQLDRLLPAIAGLSAPAPPSP